MILVVEVVLEGRRQCVRTRLVLEEMEEMPRVYAVKAMLEDAILTLPGNPAGFTVKRIPNTK